MSDILARINARRGAAVIPYEVPEWGLKCYIRPLSVAVRFGKIDKLPMAERMAETVMFGLVDEAGKPVLPQGAESLAALVSEDHVLIDRIAADIFGAKFDGDAAKNS